MGAFLAAAVLGFVDKQGYEIPVIPMLGKAGTIAVAAWAAERYAKAGRWAGELATGAGCIAVYEFVTKGSISGPEGAPGYVAGF